jgi:hypothetical protein
LRALFTSVLPKTKTPEQIRDIKGRLKNAELKRVKMLNATELEAKEEEVLRSEVEKLRTTMNVLPEKVRMHRDNVEKQRNENRILKQGMTSGDNKKSEKERKRETKKRGENPVFLSPPSRQRLH